MYADAGQITYIGKLTVATCNFEKQMHVDALTSLQIELTLAADKR